MYWTTFEISDLSDCFEPFTVAVAVDNFIYAFGGVVNIYDRIQTHVLDTRTLIWSFLPDRNDINGEQLKPPVYRAYHTVVAYEKKIYLWGGLCGGFCKCEQTNILYCFDTKTITWSRPKVTGTIPSSRFGHSACISSHIMYICGGEAVENEQKFRDVYCLDLKTMNWSNIITTGEIPSPGQYQSAAIVNNRMYILEEHKDRFFTMYLDLELNQWHRPETTGNIPDSKMVLSMFVHNNIIYVFGGYEDFETDLYYLDPKRNNWNLIKPRGSSPNVAEAQSCIVSGDKMFFLRKTSEMDIPYRTIHVLDFNPSLKTLATIAIVENDLDSSCLPPKLSGT